VFWFQIQHVPHQFGEWHDQGDSSGDSRPSLPSPKVESESESESLQSESRVRVRVMTFGDSSRDSSPSHDSSHPALKITYTSRMLFISRSIHVLTIT